MAPEVLPSYGGLIPLSDTNAVNVDARPLLLAVPVWCQAHLSAILPGHVAVLKCMEDQEAQVGVIGCIEIGRSFLLPSGQMTSASASVLHHHQHHYRSLVGNRPGGKIRRPQSCVFFSYLSFTPRFDSNEGSFTTLPRDGIYRIARS
ncbi:hypothetical protein CBS11852_10521 [Aspergillus niger]|nr:hypothetical protein CBS11852_10521 [Aspergillus niger]